MPKKNKINFDTVRKIAHELPDVTDSTSYGAPSLKARGELLACIPVNKAAEPDSLAVRIDFERRAEILTAAPETYYLPDHYVNYPIVLVRLSEIELDALRDLLRLAWRFVTAKAKPAKRKTGKSKQPRTQARS